MSSLFNSDIAKTNKTRRIVAGIMAMMILAMMLFSTFYVAAELGHHCDDEDNCPICATLQMCTNTLHNIGSGMSTLATVILPAISYILIAVLGVSVITQSTLVSQKIRLND